MTVTLFGIPLRVKLSFLLVICLLGMPLVRGVSTDPLALVGRLVIWLVVVGFSVIVHELGHALLARRYGATVSMELWAMGGLTSWRPGPRPITPARRAAIAAAGSAFGFLVGGAAFPLWRLVGPDPGLLSLTLGWLVWVNLGWGLINWLPIRLLDGGHIFRGAIEVLWPQKSEAIANYFFLCTSVAAALIAYHQGFPIAALFAAVMFFMEVRRLLPANQKTRRPAPPPPAENFLLPPPPPSSDRDMDR